ncbi:unnamed protein product [Albugo candida]|uniref:Uncharacterized protein n=1 Tax=Albugo candida TaxID=65357 RepID=A0A024GUH7_9STRA|nr:unnamed protein product [Albugo candida]|eukprot:CCI50262.1 unnamed protein product [Albugo candida]
MKVPNELKNANICYKMHCKFLNAIFLESCSVCLPIRVERLSCHTWNRAMGLKCCIYYQPDDFAHLFLVRCMPKRSQLCLLKRLPSRIAHTVIHSNSKLSLDFWTLKIDGLSILSIIFNYDSSRKYDAKIASNTRAPSCHIHVSAFFDAFLRILHVPTSES